MFHHKELDDYVKPSKKHVQKPGFFRYIEKTAEELDDEVEYDMDDQVFYYSYKCITNNKLRPTVCIYSTKDFFHIFATHWSRLAIL